MNTRHHIKLRHLLLSALLASTPVSLSAAGTALPSIALPGVANENRARINYMLNCQGCHGSDAQGSKLASVPRMKNFVGNFLRVPGGRAYLVQVPGSANASLDDAELAELLNWMLPTLSAAQMPSPFSPYTANEITALRYSPQEDVMGTRERLIHAIDSLQ